MMKRTTAHASGFTLVELAVVIALVAILAAAGASRLVTAPEIAERAVILDFLQNLKSASAMYTARHHEIPQDFQAFVSPTIPIPNDKTISTQTLGFHAQSHPCDVQPQRIVCSGTFQKYAVIQYEWNSGNFIVTGL
ncbi:MAG: prepilin-type N-terminal cleavage/methylation domain-containing protein [Vampirovibrionales bacterium]|nr:prepilin-type N-terminal cleavage/methylation domain-containing protein [Vampirovibrionales bacterium]